MPKSRWSKARGRGEVWKSLVMIHATDAANAVNKALRIGDEAIGDCHGTLHIWGKRASTRFLGMEAMGLLHEGLKDGAEILWQMRLASRDGARRLVKSPTHLLRSLESELSLEPPISKDGAHAVKAFVRAELKRLKRKGLSEDSKAPYLPRAAGEPRKSTLRQ